MKNANMPAMPVHEERGFEDGFGPPKTGLTKREYFAAMAMQAVIMGRPNIDYDEATDHAIRHADDLLAGLESK